MSDPVKEVQAQDEQEDSYNTSDPVQVNKARKRAARTRADRLEFVKASMTLAEGRAWFFDLLNRCHLWRTSFDESPTRLAFLVGEENIGKMILGDIQDAAPDKYIIMIEENRKNG
jgi:hypothetical protein